MGLAGERKKQRIGWDPRNLNWLATPKVDGDSSKAENEVKSFKESNFGLKLLMMHGYEKKNKSKTNEEIMESIINSKEFGHNIKIKVKDDKFGIGYSIGGSKINKKINPRTGKVDAVEGDDNFGLDMFQQILFSLNNKESSKDRKKRKQVESMNEELTFVRAERIRGKYGMDFVKGEVLKSELAAILMKEKEAKKGNKKEKKDKKEKKSKKGNKEEKDAEKGNKKDKKEKKDKKGSKKRKRETDSEDSVSAKKHKKDKKKSKKNAPAQHDMNIGDVQPVELAGTRFAARSKFIRSKRSAISDPAALKEIFMMS